MLWFTLFIRRRTRTFSVLRQDVSGLYTEHENILLFCDRMFMVYSVCTQKNENIRKLRILYSNCLFVCACVHVCMYMYVCVGACGCVGVRACVCIAAGVKESESVSWETTCVVSSVLVVYTHSAVISLALEVLVHIARLDNSKVG